MEHAKRVKCTVALGLALLLLGGAAHATPVVYRNPADGRKKNDRPGRGDASRIIYRKLKKANAGRKTTCLNKKKSMPR